MTAWVRIVIVDFKSGHHLQNCIDCLRVQSFRNFEVIIVDNSCPEGAAQKLSGRDDRFNIISTEENLGYAGGCNIGANGANTPWLIMLNPDTLSRVDWLEHLHIATLAYPQVDMLSTTLVTAEDPDILDGFGDVLSIYGLAWRGGHGLPLSTADKEDKFVFAPCGAAAMYRRTAFLQVGGFDQDFFCYIEDVDLAWRLRRAGAQCVQVRRAICQHVGSVSTQSNPGFRYYHSARNTIWMIIKCAPLWLLPVMLILNILSMSYLYIRGAYRGSGSLRFKGVWHGYREAYKHWKKRRTVFKAHVTSGLYVKYAAESWLVFSVKKLRNQSISSRKIKPIV